MRKQSRLFQCQAGLVLLLSVLLGLGQMLPATAHPYQIISAQEYEQEQAKLREMIKRDPKNPDLYLKLGTSFSYEAAEGYWCETRAIALYREAIAIVPPNAELHLRLGSALVAEPAVACDEPPLVAEGSFHLRKAIAIASETASVEALFQAADLLTQVKNQVKP